LLPAESFAAIRARLIVFAVIIGLRWTTLERTLVALRGRRRISRIAANARTARSTALDGASSRCLGACNAESAQHLGGLATGATYGCALAHCINMVIDVGRIHPWSGRILSLLSFGADRSFIDFVWHEFNLELVSARCDGNKVSTTPCHWRARCNAEAFCGVRVRSM
jgi:hypothetical protein